MADPQAHTGRGHRIPMAVVQSIIARVSWGETVATAAGAYGYTDRTVFRVAAREPRVREALTTALQCRRVISIVDDVREPLADVVDTAEADRCPPGCCCDVCEAERLLVARRAARAGVR